MVGFLGIAAPNPPQPLPLEGPPPPGDSIDGYIIALMVLAITFGYYKIKSIQKPQEV